MMSLTHFILINITKIQEADIQERLKEIYESIDEETRKGKSLVYKTLNYTPELPVYSHLSFLEFADKLEEIEEVYILHSSYLKERILLKNFISYLERHHDYEEINQYIPTYILERYEEYRNTNRLFSSNEVSRRYHQKNEFNSLNIFKKDLSKHFQQEKKLLKAYNILLM